MNTLSPKQSQLLAVAILLVVIAALYSLFLSPLLTRYITSSEQIEQLEHQKAVYERVAAGMESNQAQLEALRQNNPIADLYLAETRPTLAAAELQQHLSRMVGASGGQVVSTQILQKDSDGALSVVALQVHIRGEISDLVNLLYSIESGRPLLFVENLQISSVAQRTPQRRVQARRNQAPRKVLPSLDVRFDLIAHSAREG